MVAFTQYVAPHGRKKETGIERPDEIETLAQKFIDAGGRYECEVLSTGHASLTACMEVDGEMQDVEIVVCANGPGLPERVDELVRKSVKHIPAEATP